MPGRTPAFLGPELGTAASSSRCSCAQWGWAYLLPGLTGREVGSRALLSVGSRVAKAQLWSL